MPTELCACEKEGFSTMDRGLGLSVAPRVFIQTDCFHKEKETSHKSVAVSPLRSTSTKPRRTLAVPLKNTAVDTYASSE